MKTDNNFFLEKKTKMNKKIVLLGALTLCVTTASFAMDSFTIRMVIYGTVFEPKDNNENGETLNELRKTHNIGPNEKYTITVDDNEKITTQLESAIRDITPHREKFNPDKTIKTEYINTQKDKIAFFDPLYDACSPDVDAIVTINEKTIYKEYSVGPGQYQKVIFYNTQSYKEKKKQEKEKQEKKKQKKERQKKKKQEEKREKNKKKRQKRKKKRTNNT